MGLALNPTRYKKVLVQHMPQPIESDEEYDRWVDILESIDRSPSSSVEERALAALMKIAMTEYDRKHDPELYSSNPLGTLHYAMEQSSSSQADLARLLDVSRSTACNIYAGKRGISKAVAAKLAKHFKLSITAFLPEAK